MKLQLFKRVLGAQMLVTCLTIFVAFPVSAQLACKQVYGPKPSAPRTGPTRQHKAADVRPPSLSPTVAEMREHLTGVHMTDYLPLDGVIRTSTTTASRMAPLSTLHFALGEMVVSHQLGDWQNKKYAILVPFKNLEPQLLNIFHQDTYVLGDLRLQAGTILLAPVGEKVSPIPGVKVIYFDPAKKEIRQAVRETLVQNGQWTFESNGPYTYSEVLNSGRNLNNETFFKHLLEEYPHITFDLHSHDLIGKLEIYSGHHFEALFGKGKKQGADEVEQVWRVTAAKFDWDLAQVDTRMASVTQSKLKDEYQIWRKRFTLRQNLLWAEAELQKTTGKTVLGTPELPIDFREAVIRLAANREKLIQFLKENAEVLQDKKELDKDELRVELSNRVGYLRSSLPLQQFSEFLRTNPEITERVGGKHFQESLKQVEDGIENHQNGAKAKRAVEILKDELAVCNRSQCWYYVHRMVSRKLDRYVLEILAQPRVRENLGRYFDLSIFEQFTLASDGDPRTFVWIAKEAKGLEADPQRRDKFVASYAKEDLVARPRTHPAPSH